jgi:hypothetical protein
LTVLLCLLSEFFNLEAALWSLDPTEESLAQDLRHAPIPRLLTGNPHTSLLTLPSVQSLRLHILWRRQAQHHLPPHLLTEEVGL